jgi:hypothetical protein
MEKEGLSSSVMVTLKVVVLISLIAFGAIFVAGIKQTVVNETIATYSPYAMSVPTGIKILNGTGGSLANRTYYFRIAASDGTGLTNSTEFSNDVQGSNNEVFLNWTAVTGATGYRIYFGNASTAEYAYFTNTTPFYRFNTVASATSGKPQNFTDAVVSNYTYSSTADQTAVSIVNSGETLLVNIMTYAGILVLAIFFGLALRYLVYYIGGLGGAMGRGGE